MANAKIWEYTVEGRGTFPFDMLRYDRAWPATETDAGILTRHNNRGRTETGEYKVKLHALDEGTPARWNSFGWRVVPIARGRHT